jgi:hypothetical protein
MILDENIEQQTANNFIVFNKASGGVDLVVMTVAVLNNLSTYTDLRSVICIQMCFAIFVIVVSSRLRTRICPDDIFTSH